MNTLACLIAALDSLERLLAHQTTHGIPAGFWWGPIAAWSFFAIVNALAIEF